MKYADLSRKEKQLIASQYPYKSDKDLFGTSSTIPSINNLNDIKTFKKASSEIDNVDIMKKSSFISTTNGITSVIDLVLGDLSEDDYRSALELAKIDFDPISILKELFAIETTRLRSGIEYEKELSLGLEQDTQAAMNSLVSIVKTIHELEEGKKLSLDFSSSLTGLIQSIDYDDQNDDIIEVEVKNE